MINNNNNHKMEINCVWPRQSTSSFPHIFASRKLLGVVPLAVVNALANDSVKLCVSCTQFSQLKC